MATSQPPSYDEPLYDDPKIPHPSMIVRPAYRSGSRKQVIVIWVGEEVGMFDSWEEAEPFVKGVPGCRYKGFSTWPLAFHHYQEKYNQQEVRRVEIEPLAPGNSVDAPVEVPSTYPTPAPGQRVWPINVPSSPGDHAARPIVVGSSPIQMRAPPRKAAPATSTTPGKAAPTTRQESALSAATAPPSSDLSSSTATTGSRHRSTPSTARGSGPQFSPAPVRQAPPSSPTPARHAPSSTPSTPRSSASAPRSPPVARVLFPQGHRPASQPATPTSGSQSQRGSERLAQIQALIENLPSSTTVNINVSINLTPSRSVSTPSATPRPPRPQPTPGLATDVALELFSDLLNTPTLSTVDEDDWGDHLTIADRERIDDYPNRTPSPLVRYDGPHY